MADSSPGRTYAGAKLKLMLIPMGDTNTESEED
nr:MAG TPA: hypothetical protein [Caudoviricetes sp.]